MLTNKVNNYQHKILDNKQFCLAVFVELLEEFKIIPENWVGFYSELTNLHYDLKIQTESNSKRRKPSNKLTKGVKHERASKSKRGNVQRH